MAARQRLRFFSAVAMALLVGWPALAGREYLLNFRFDASGERSRVTLARTMLQPRLDSQTLRVRPVDVALLADPAPYGCPPMD